MHGIWQIKDQMIFFIKIAWSFSKIHSDLKIHSLIYESIMVFNYFQKKIKYRFESLLESLPRKP